MSELDLSDAKAILNRAIDRNDTVALADWARRFGPEIIRAAEDGVEDGDGDW